MGAASELQCRLADGELRLLLDPSFLFNCAAAGQGAVTILAGALLATAAWLAKGVVQGVFGILSRRQATKELLIAMIVGVERSAEDYRQNFDGASRDRLVARIRSAAQHGRSFTPFSTVVTEDFILDQVKVKISVVPERLVAAVTRYVYNVDLITAALADFRSEAFADLAADRKIAQVTHIYALAAETATLGTELLARLRRERRLMQGIELFWLVAATLAALWSVRWATLHQW